jgi:hypothetical protein
VSASPTRSVETPSKVFVGKPRRPCLESISLAVQPSNKTGGNNDASASAPLPNSCSVVLDFLAAAEVPLQHLHPLFIRLGLKDKVRQTSSAPFPYLLFLFPPFLLPSK